MPASGQRSSLSIVKESSYGVPSGTAFKTLRFTDTSLNQKRDLIKSKEIRADRQLVDGRHGAGSVVGDTSHELGLLDYDLILEAALGGAFALVTPPYLAKSGTNLDTFTIERAFNDIGQFIKMTGCAVDQLKLSVKPGNDAIAMMTISWLGQKADLAAVTHAGSLVAAGTHKPFDAYKAVLKEGGTTISTVTGLELNITNNRAVQATVGQADPQRVHEGQFDVSGSLTAFFEDASLLAKFLAGTESTLELDLNDPNGTDYHKIVIPRTLYSGGELDNPASGPIILTLPFIGLLDGTTGASLTWERSNAT